MVTCPLIRSIKLLIWMQKALDYHIDLIFSEYDFWRLLSKKMEFPKIYGLFYYFPGLIIIIIGIKSMLALRIIYETYLKILVNGF